MAGHAEHAHRLLPHERHPERGQEPGEGDAGDPDESLQIGDWFQCGAEFGAFHAIIKEILHTFLAMIDLTHV